MRSMHDFPFQKRAFSWRSSLTTVVVMRWRIMRQKALLLIEGSVIPLKLSQSDIFHLFGSLMIVAHF